MGFIAVAFNTREPIIDGALITKRGANRLPSSPRNKPKSGRPRPPSIADVAARAQVSKATVSLVLNHKSREMAISDATRRRVLIAAREIDYRPPVPHVYQRHVRGLIRHIALVLVSPMGVSDHEFLAPMYYAIMRAAGDEDLLVHAADGVRPEDAADYCTRLRGRDADGLIVSTLAHEAGPWLDTFIASRLPLVVLNRNFNAKAPCVVMDHQGHGSDQTGLLLEAGHRRIGCLSTFLGPASERAEGYRRRLREAGLYDPALERPASYSIESAVDAGVQLLRSDPSITAVFCTNDVLAAALLRAARRLGRAVPSDLSITSIDGYEFSAYCEPPLCTVQYPRAEMGRAALKLLREVAQKDFRSSPVVTVRGDFVPGGSIAGRSDH